MNKYDIILFIIFRVLYIIGFVPLYFAADLIWKNFQGSNPTDAFIFLGIGFIYIFAVRLAEMQICENPKNN